MASKAKTHKGRAKGTPNKATAQMRDRLHAADPMGLLLSALQSGRIENLGTDGKPDGTHEDLNATNRIRIAETLIKKYVPDAKDRTVNFKLGSIECVSDAVKAMGAILQAVANGEITPSEGNAISNTLNTFARIFETSELQARLEALEHQHAESTK